MKSQDKKCSGWLLVIVVTIGVLALTAKSQWPISVASTISESSTTSLSSLVADLRSRAIELFDLTNNGRPLTIGSKGTDVWALQAFLETDAAGSASVELASIGLTGYFGAATEKALAEYQASEGITPVTGYFGSKTEAIMLEEASSMLSFNTPTTMAPSTTKFPILTNATSGATSTIPTASNPIVPPKYTGGVSAVIVSTPTPDTTPPALPTSFAVSAGDASSTLTWSDPTGSDLSYISIYRGTASTSLTLIATTSPGIETYTDVPTHNGTTYYYALTATDSSGNQSAQTVAVSSTPVGVYNIYVDSVNGSDSNDGTSAYEAYQSLSKASTAATNYSNGVKIGLARGSYWRDELNLSTLNDVTVSAYGNSTTTPPLIDAADVLPSSTWLAVSGYPNVYVATSTATTESGTNGVLGSFYYRVWEDGAETLVSCKMSLSGGLDSHAR